MLNLKKHILIIDDEIKICDLIADVLIDENYKLTAATNGYDGLTVLKNQSIDLIILDLHMPRINGLGLLDKIKEINKTVPIIILSAWLPKSEFRLKLEKETKVILEKPIELAALTESIRKYI